MGCERHKLHIYCTGNVESLHFETSQMECGRLIREDQPAFFYSVSIKKRDKVKMAGDCGLNALSLLPENVLPQWQQKMLTQKIKRDDVVTRLWTHLFSARSAIFCRYWTCSFSRRNNQAIEAEVVCIFTFFYMPNGNGNKKMPQLSSENCGWLPHRDSNSVKQNQNLVCYHYTMGQSILILRFCGRKDTRLFRHFQIFREKSFGFARSLWGNVMCVAQNHSAHHMLR